MDLLLRLDGVVQIHVLGLGHAAAGNRVGVVVVALPFPAGDDVLLETAREPHGELRLVRQRPAMMFELKELTVDVTFAFHHERTPQ